MIRTEIIAAISTPAATAKIRMRFGCFFFPGELIDVDAEDPCDGALRGEEAT